jgi:hypothetical protein
MRLKIRLDAVIRIDGVGEPIAAVSTFTNARFLARFRDRVRKL